MSKPVEIEFLMKDRLSSSLDKAGRKVDELSGKADTANKRIQELDKSTEGVRKAVTRLAAAFTIKELVSNITRVRGQFQQLEVAFETMLGSAEKADALMNQLVNTAATTPFGLEDVSQGAKQLLAYGLEAEKVNETLIRLGDIAAGLSVPLNDLVYLYGTTMAQGRLYTQDLNQFTGRGIPMISELAKQFGVAESRVKELVEEGKVGFPEVQKVIESLTDEGGKFGGLMEAQSKTITGQISNIEDAIDSMFNNLGKQSEGAINTVLSGVSYMVENYERFGRVLLGLVATYGTYRTALMLVAAAEGWATAAEALHYNWLLLVEKAQKLLNATMLANPYVLVATAIAGVVAVMVSMKTEAERLKEAEEAYEAQKQKVIEAEEEHRRKMEELCSVAGDEALSTDVRREALNKLEQKYPDIFAKYDTEYEKLKNIKKIKQEIAELEAGQSITKPQNELRSVNDRIKALEEKRATEHYVTGYSTAGAYSMKVGGLSSKEEMELKNLYGKRDSLSKQVRKDSVNAYFENLTGISNDTLSQQIKQRENLLALMKVQEKKYGKITQGNSSLTGTFSQDELQYQLNKLRSEQNRRNKPTDSSADWGEAAKKKYQDALKAYNDFIKDTSNNLTKEEFEKKAKELKEAVDTAKKEYDKTKPGTDKDETTADKRAKKEEAAAEKRKQTEEKLGQELAELRRKNDADDTELMEEGLQKKLRQIDNDYQARKNEIAKQESDWKQDNKKAGLTDVGEDGLTVDQVKELGRASDQNEKKRQKAIAETYKSEFSAMQEHLKEYGTYQQQKLAITEEYAEKIRNATSEGEKLSLSVERDSQLASIEAQELKANIDWSSVFGEFGGMFSDVIRPVLEDAKKYMQTDEFANADHSSQETLITAVRQMEKSLGGADKVSFKKLGTDITAYQQSLAALREAQADYATDFTALQEAQRQYVQAMSTGTEEEKEAARLNLENAQANADATAKNIDSLQATADAAKQTVTDTATNLKTSMDNVRDGLQQIASGSVSGAYEGLITLGKGAKDIGGALGEAFGKVSDALEDVPIIGWIVSIIDVFKDGLSVVVEGLLDAVFNAVSGIIGDVLSGDLFVSIGESLLNGIGNIFDSLTWGGFSSWFGGESDKTLEKDIETLTESNESLEAAIDRLADKLDDASLVESKSIYETQVADLEQQMKNTQEMMSRSGAAYSNGFLGIGGSHSSNHKINKAMTDSEWAQISEIVGRTIDSADDFWSLSSEEMWKVADEAYSVYSKIQQYADDGYKNAAEYMDTYIEYYEQLQELQDAYREKLTSYSFDDIESEFESQLLDMETDAEDFADSFEDMMKQAVVNSMMSNTYSKKLKEWYEAFADSLESGGELTAAEQEELRSQYEAIVNSALAERDALIEAMDWDVSSSTSQSAKSGSFDAMTQDQGTKLEGMFTSGLQHWSSMDSRLENVSEKMDTAEGHLARIAENTGASAGHLSEIKEDIKKMIRDGLKVK